MKKFLFKRNIVCDYHFAQRNWEYAHGAALALSCAIQRIETFPNRQEFKQYLESELKRFVEAENENEKIMNKYVRVYENNR